MVELAKAKSNLAAFQAGVALRRRVVELAPKQAFFSQEGSRDAEQPES
jgi:hypothetical protein